MNALTEPSSNCYTGDLTDPSEIQAKADQWYPSEAHETPELAEALCGGCPAVADCYEYALTLRLEGIWGATTTEQRNDALAGRKRPDPPAKPEFVPTHGTAAGYLWHYRRKQKACDPCLAAQAEASRAKRARNSTKKGTAA